MKKHRGAAALILTASLLLVGGCDFFESSGPEGGVSPFVTGLRINRSSVPCDRDFVITFNYEDPQDDIEFMRVTFQHESGFTFAVEVLFESGGGFVTEEGEEIPEDLFGGTLDLSVPGRASYVYRFECGTGKPTGSYTVTVQLVDENGHESTPRSENISLITS